MPIYEFRCVECGNLQEIIVSSTSEDVSMTCKECGGETLERVLSTVSYMMGSSSAGKGEGPSLATKSCGEGNSCSTLTLPGYTR